jgi:signal transduction histidine kinase
MDWSRSPLGPIEAWPQSLKTTVSLCLASNFPISIAWGKECIQIYNDGYWPICGDKHPWAIGQDFRECWSSAWPVIGPAFEQAKAGKAAFLVNQRMFLDRNGYLEETFFTFSFSPIRDESGGVGGLFHPVTELTQQSLAERRLKILREIAVGTTSSKTVLESAGMLLETLALGQLDVPFCLLYLADADVGIAHLVGSTGFQANSETMKTALPLATLVESLGPESRFLSQQFHVGGIEEKFGVLAEGPYPEKAKMAVILPIMVPGLEQAFGYLVAGVSPRRPLDDPYRTFFDLLRSAATNGISNARNIEEEHKRAQELEAIDRAKTAFFSNVSHEFRTPLTLMLGPLEDLMANGTGQTDGPAQETLKVIHRNGIRLLKLVNTLLDFARIEGGRANAAYEPVDLGALTTDLASVFRSAIERAGLHFEVTCSTPGMVAYVDREMWEKIVFNLLSNALKYTLQGSIEVTLEAVNAGFCLSVRDSGIGIAPSEIARVFERFHRIKGTKARTHEGTGIGLALVDELSRLHGGSVHVSSELNVGSVFSVTIPEGFAHLPPERVKSHSVRTVTNPAGDQFIEEALQWAGTADDRSTDVSLSPANGHATDDPPARIILADDNADMRDYVARLLRRRWTVEAVENGTAALKAALENVPDLVLSDVMMPEMDGFELLAALRADGRTRGVPVILLSARAGEESRVEGMEASADDYLVKPFSARELMARVGAHLELARVRSARAEIESYAHVLEKSVAERTQHLERTLRTVEAFNYSIAHDLRSPLRAMRAFSKSLLANESASLTPNGRRDLQLVDDAATRMNQLISDLLTFGRISSEDIHLQAVDLDSLVRDVVMGLGHEIPEGKSALTLADSFPPVMGHPILLRQVLVNLIGNAVKFMPPGRRPRVIIRWEATKGAVRVWIEDNGIGIPDTLRLRVFELFQRLHTTEAYPGTGVGLAIVKKGMERMDGKVGIESGEDSGSRFWIELQSAETRSRTAYAPASTRDLSSSLWSP